MHLAWISKSVALRVARRYMLERRRLASGGRSVKENRSTLANQSGFLDRVAPRLSGATSSLPY